MDKAKKGLQVLSTILRAAPIPDPFKSAVTAIPDIALQIMAIIEGVKGNVQGAEALAVQIANVTEMDDFPLKPKPALRRAGSTARLSETRSSHVDWFARALRDSCTKGHSYVSVVSGLSPVSRGSATKTRGDLERSPDTKQRLEAFALVLKQIKGEIEALMARDLSSRILNYDGDASKLAAMKERVNDAMKDLQLETVLATDHGVDVISQDLRLMNQKQDMLAQQQTRQQVLASWQQYMSTPEPRNAGLYYFSIYRIYG
ncbi:hypothetical protein FRB93_006327 [Tulasnella sp. JGI-2019a]|nr:hypothetical protein FRB93_006327 [Tulasnella sp. JGI-2019a]